jgi:hypothetical protein
MSDNSASGRVGLSLMTFLIACWGLLGWFDLADRTQAGFSTDGNNTVIQVYPTSPAESAGLEVGDFITYVDGISVEEAATIARMPRKKMGEIGVYSVERFDQKYEISIRYGPLLEKTLSLSRVSLIVGFCFVLFPLGAYFRKSSEATRILSVMGIGLGLAFMTGPYIADFSIRSVTTAITSLFVLFGVAALLQFLLVFPHRRPWMNRPHLKKLIYLPAFLLWALIAYRMVFTPAATSSLNTLTNLFSGVIVGGYLLLSLYHVLRNYSKTDQASRKALALNSMLWGAVIGLLPVTIAQLTTVFSPQSVLPGQDYYFVTLALIPLTWARSASR